MDDVKVHLPDRSTRKSFLMSAFIMLILGVILIILTYSTPFSLQDPKILKRILDTVMGVLMILISVTDLWFIKVVRIITSPAGIGLYSPGFELHTDWANLEKISSHAVLLGMRKYDCLLLRQPGTHKNTWWMSPLTSQGKIEIPLSMHKDWRESELGQEIKKYAPHLFG